MRHKSDENWDVGTRCLQSGQTNAAASRLYYAVCQAVYEFANKKEGYTYQGYGFHTRMASTVRNHGKQSRYYWERFGDLMDLRTKADYDRDSPTDEEVSDILTDANAIRTFFFKEAEK